MMHLEPIRSSAIPFPHVECAEVFPLQAYVDLLAAWPDESNFKVLSGPYVKLALSERCYPKHYAETILGSVLWRGVHKYIKSPAFITSVFGVLRRSVCFIPEPGSYTSRFEFSSLPSDGGAIAPHRDIPSKILTIVVPMTLEAVPGWGTDILEPLGPVGNDYETPRDAFRTVASFDYAPNTCGIFVKTADSWHAIGPLKGPAGQFRKTLTINVERV